MALRRPGGDDGAFEGDFFDGHAFPGVFGGTVFDGGMAVGTVESLGADPDAVALIEMESDFDGAGFAYGELVEAVGDVVGVAEIEAAGDDGEGDGFGDLVAVTGDAEFVGAGGGGAEVGDDGAGETAVIEDDDGAVGLFEPMFADGFLVAVAF